MRLQSATAASQTALDLRFGFIPEVETSEYMAGAYLSAMRRDPCSYCGGVAEQLDHIEPVGRRQRRPTAEWDNLTAACHPCNSTKRAKGVLVAVVANRIRRATDPLLQELADWTGEHVNPQFLPTAKG